MTLTESDREAIKHAAMTTSAVASEREAIYRAGLAAGRAAAIEECAKVCDEHPAASLHPYDVATECAAAIRALGDAKGA